MKPKHCCESMDYYLNQKCDIHEDPFACPDSIIWYLEKFDEYGIIIHDGGTSYIGIQYCPWCGMELPNSKRDLWFEELAKDGIEHPLEQDIPNEFKTDEWWNKLEYE